MTELTDSIVEFLECAVHSVLYVRGIYPAELFERRMYLGVAVWQARHPEINSYIHRIMKNLKPLIQKDAVDRVVVATLSDVGTPIDHISFKCKTMSAKHSSYNSSNDEMQWYEPSRSDTAFSTVQEELRSCILRVGLLDTQLPKLPDDCTWSMMVITSKDCTQQQEGEAALQSALTGGEWYVDTNLATEQLGVAQKVNSEGYVAGHNSFSHTDTRAVSATSNGANATGTESNSNANPKLVPIKSFQNELLNLSVYAHVFPSR